jgi:hypothetical protein
VERGDVCHSNSSSTDDRGGFGWCAWIGIRAGHDTGAVERADAEDDRRAQHSANGQGGAGASTKVESRAVRHPGRLLPHSAISLTGEPRRGANRFGRTHHPGASSIQTERLFTEGFETPKLRFRRS